MSIKKSGLNFFDKLVLWFNYAVVAALLVGYLAPIVDPRKFWPAAFFGLAYPPVLLINALLVVYWLLRRKKWAFLSLTGILVGWKVLNNNIGLRLPSNAVRLTDTSCIRVMNYNVHGFDKFDAKTRSSTKHEILQIIDHQQPDVIGFEEFYMRNRGSYAMIDSIKQVLKSNAVFYAPFIPGINVPSPDSFGMAVFSKYPIIDKGIVWLNEKQNLNQCLYIDVKKNSRILRVYVVHLQSIRFGPEDYQYLDSVSKKGKADVYSMRRIGAKLKYAFIKRAEQVTKLKQHMATCLYPYVVTGDFNDTPSSYAVNKMSEGLKNAFCEKGSGLGRTYNGDFPNYQIDYIMASKQFDVLSYGVIRKKLSDHYPVYSDLKLK